MPSADDGNGKSRFAFERSRSWQDSVRHGRARPARHLVWLVVALLLALWAMSSLNQRGQRHARSYGDNLRVIELSPAPESALPLMPFVGARPGAEIEFKALLMRIPTSRQVPPALLSVHTLSGKLGEPLSEHVGLHGEYELGFTAHYDAARKQILLSDFHFAPVGAGPEAKRSGHGPEIVLEPEKPRRIDPPMEPGVDGPLVLQLTGRLSGQKAATP